MRAFVEGALQAGRVGSGRWLPALRTLELKPMHFDDDLLETFYQCVSGCSDLGVAIRTLRLRNSTLMQEMARRLRMLINVEEFEPFPDDDGLQPL